MNITRKFCFKLSVDDLLFIVICPALFPRVLLVSKLTASKESRLFSVLFVKIKILFGKSVFYNLFPFTTFLNNQEVVAARIHLHQLVPWYHCNCYSQCYISFSQMRSNLWLAKPDHNYSCHK